MSRLFFHSDACMSMYVIQFIQNSEHILNNQLNRLLIEYPASLSQYKYHQCLTVTHKLSINQTLLARHKKNLVTSESCADRAVGSSDL